MKSVEFKALYEAAIDDPPEPSMIMKYNTTRSYKRNKKIIFVEGGTDCTFYRNTNIEVLCAESSYYIFVRKNTVDEKYELKGKKAVIDAYRRISSDDSLKKDLYRCIFIVDQDWEKEISSEISTITKTYGHSMENYFLERENLNIILDTCNIPREEQEKFKEEYNQFCKETSSFWAMKGTIVYAKEQGEFFSYKKKKTFDEIFNFYYEDCVKYDVTAMNEEKSLMWISIDNNSKLKAYYLELKKKIDAETRFVRGHEAFNYLQCYLRERHGIELDFSRRSIDLFDDIVSKFNVQMNIVELDNYRE